MLWSRNAKTVSLVINPAPFAEGTGNYRRQKYAMDVLRESSPSWVTSHFLPLWCDRAGLEEDSLYKDSESLLGERPPLPSVKEMMATAIGKQPNADWAGVAVSDLIFTGEVWQHFQKGDHQILICRASQMPDEDEESRIVATPIKKWNQLSLDALFIRGEAIEVFMSDFPDVFLAEYWDDAAQAWARRHRKLGLKVLSDHETMHRVHAPSWAQGVKYMNNTPEGLRAVGVYNRTKVVEFKQARKKMTDPYEFYTKVHTVVNGFFGNINTTTEWMITKNPLLGGRSPFEMIQKGLGLQLLKFVKTQLDENKP
jgi:hypothetical protein